MALPMPVTLGWDSLGEFMAMTVSLEDLTVRQKVENIYVMTSSEALH